ncbi:Hypothetical predicted protein [Olea europaea subsp. europaea]|uniref:Uncharacterized protein n=1 Tax=Olea europaea subsp. europaea TaxID=158383 RepID=A0A8S0V7M7_OLEEU|nr:Hypothetical predicted protein [Olea europaea subsp. europaea]
MDGDTFTIKLAELPHGLLDDYIDAPLSIVCRQIESTKGEVVENKVMADVERAREIEERSKAESITIEVKDSIEHHENKEDIELSEEPLPKPNDIQRMWWKTNLEMLTLNLMKTLLNN